MEEALRQNGDTAEAQYVNKIRNWYEAIDTPGLSAADRVEKLLSFRQYLLDGVSFCSFPPPGQFLKGMSLVQFCGFIQNTDIRLQLYNIGSGTYNHRAIDTLAVESFFVDLTELDPTGCPKAVKIPRMLSNVTEINNYRHDADNRCFSMATKAKSVYPIKVLDGILDLPATATGVTQCTISATNRSRCTKATCIPKDHVFDQPERCSKKRHLKSARISLPHEPSRGTLPVRALRFKRDESKISTLMKLGLKDDLSST